jgi:hypothetical protein
LGRQNAEQIVQSYVSQFGLAGLHSETSTNGFKNDVQFALTYGAAGARADELHEIMRRLQNVDFFSSELRNRRDQFLSHALALRPELIPYIEPAINSLKSRNLKELYRGVRYDSSWMNDPTIWLKALEIAGQVTHASQVQAPPPSASPTRAPLPNAQDDARGRIAAFEREITGQLQPCVEWKTGNMLLDSFKQILQIGIRGSIKQTSPTMIGNIVMPGHPSADYNGNAAGLPTRVRTYSYPGNLGPEFVYLFHNYYTVGSIVGTQYRYPHATSPAIEEAKIGINERLISWANQQPPELTDAIYQPPPL